MQPPHKRMCPAWREGYKPVVVSHSYGAVVFTTFLLWAEQAEPGWADAHLHAYVNLAGALLGVPKAIAPMLSGGWHRARAPAPPPPPCNSMLLAWMCPSRGPADAFIRP